MKYSGIVYIFDFDDTLYWTSDWYEEARLNRDGFIYSPGKSTRLKNALELFQQLSLDESIPENLRGLKLKTEKKFQLDGRDIYFAVVDSNNAPVKIEDLQPYLSPEQFSATGIRVNKNFSPFAVITNDDAYYLNPETVGERGENPEILDLYKQHHANSVILTARKNVPGMVEQIAEILKEHPPLHIYTQPIDSPNSGKYKGNVILEIASQPEVTEVHFYDDNLKYIKRVQEALDTYDEQHGTNLNAKVHINAVSDAGKPINKLKMAYAYSNILSRDYYLRRIGYVDRYIKELYDE